MAAPTPPAFDALRLPPEVAEELIGYGLQTQPGQALWRGFLLGCGLPKGDGAVRVERATYTPAAPAEPPAVAPLLPEGGP